MFLLGVRSRISLTHVCKLLEDFRNDIITICSWNFAAKHLTTANDISVLEKFCFTICRYMCDVFIPALNELTQLQVC